MGAVKFAPTPEQEDAILAAVADGQGVGQVCELFGVCTDTLRQYRKRNPDFAARYEEALEHSADSAMDALGDMAMEMIKNPSLPSVARARESAFRMLAFWIARRHPAKYGDKLDMRVTQQLDMRQVMALADARLAALRLPDVHSIGAARI